jgi:hypothetical protein
MEISFREALSISVRQLNSIPIPAGLIESVGIPICTVVSQLTECLKAMDKKEGDQEDGVGD